MKNHAEHTEYAHHLTASELDELLRHGHIIPVRRGITGRYVQEHLPGWTWNGLMDVWRAADVLHRSRSGTLRTRDDVVAVHFTDADHVAVERRPVG